MNHICWGLMLSEMSINSYLLLSFLLVISDPWLYLFCQCSAIHLQNSLCTVLAVSSCFFYFHYIQRALNSLGPLSEFYIRGISLVSFWSSGAAQSSSTGIARVQKRLSVLVGDELFSTMWHLFKKETLLISHYSTAISMADVRTNYFPWPH